MVREIAGLRPYKINGEWRIVLARHPSRVIGLPKIFLGPFVDEATTWVALVHCTDFDLEVAKLIADQTTLTTKKLQWMAKDLKQAIARHHRHPTEKPTRLVTVWSYRLTVVEEGLSLS